MGLFIQQRSKAYKQFKLVALGMYYVNTVTYIALAVIGSTPISPSM